MAHTPQPPSDQYPSAGDRLGQGWLARRLGGIVSGAEGAQPPETPGHGPLEVEAIADAMPASRLAPGGRRVLDSPFSNPAKTASGDIVGVSGVVLAEDTAVAIVHHYDGTRPKPDGKVIRVSFVELAVGSHAVSTGKPGTGKLIGKVDVRSLKNPREDGVVRLGESVTLGREEMSGGSHMSSKHFTATVSETGVVIRDGGAEDPEDPWTWKPSANGTAVLAARELNDMRGETDHRALQIMSELNTEPHTWLPDSNQHLRIVRAQ